MFPFPDIGLRLVHDERVHDALEHARIDAELARVLRRTERLSTSPLRNVLIRIRSRLNIFARIEHLFHRPYALSEGDTYVKR